MVDVVGDATEPGRKKEEVEERLQVPSVGVLVHEDLSRVGVLEDFPGVKKLVEDFVALSKVEEPNLPEFM